MTAVRAVVFDLGHTLWDFAPREESRRLKVVRLHERLSRALDGAVPAPTELDRALGATAQRWFESWIKQPEDLEQPPTERLIGEALASLALSVSDDLLHELTCIVFGAELDIPVMEPDSLAAIAGLHQRGLAMGCVTNTITLEEGIHDALARLGLRHYLRSVVASSAAGYRKPHPSLFLRALEGLDVEPGEAVFVGDRLFDDVSGAQAVGMRAVLTHQYRQEPLDGASVAPDAVIQRLGDLPAVIQRLNNRRA
ncbi:MAG: hypothetical protein A2148_06935 [Chloroflexi bacterium RBG_16_68_14]|nr:MAG: hypothetical protein A2148_06935 [Chloroflexi bacterium RBG_16_68_14]